jgi:hypothetical protein
MVQSVTSKWMDALALLCNEWLWRLMMMLDSDHNPFFICFWLDEEKEKRKSNLIGREFRRRINNKNIFRLRMLLD